MTHDVAVELDTVAHISTVDGNREERMLTFNLLSPFYFYFSRLGIVPPTFWMGFPSQSVTSETPPQIRLELSVPQPQVTLNTVDNDY